MTRQLERLMGEHAGERQQARPLVGRPKDARREAKRYAEGLVR
jgi:hypothetical protein